jgi:predicted nuclease of restriction endonuclease-like (RecB) superfamily
MQQREVKTARGYGQLLNGLTDLLEEARRSAVRAVNRVMTATYWEIGHRIVEFEQGGEKRAEYGEQVLARLAADLTTRYGRGFSRYNLQFMRQFYLAFPKGKICETLSHKSCDRISLSELANIFPLPWSHYVLLVRRSRSPEALNFYHGEALRGGWSVRQLDRQIASQFYERTALSRNKAAMLEKGANPKLEDVVTPEEEIRDPLVLEFLNLKDEYSESDMESALIRHLENFLMELGGDFAFIGRQQRLRLDDEWYRVDLVLFHRRLRSLVIIDLKIGKFTLSDAGQMHLYLNYAREHWVRPGENPPIGLILCEQKGEAVAHYALENLPSKVLPDERDLAREIARTRDQFERRLMRPDR